MKIKNLSCTQFAGIRDKSLEFHDGVNLIYGKNESGKSTVVNLISRTLFQNPKINARVDKDFCRLYFPSAKKGSAYAGDFADGRISIVSDAGEYTLSKEWGKHPSCSLSAPDGVFRDSTVVDAVLRQALVYGEGVYSDLLFSSQKNTDRSLETLLDAGTNTDTKKEITAAVSKAFSESGGISMDAVESAIHEKIEAIAGKHWDFEKNQPQRKSGRWANGLGEILKAYYAFEDAGNLLREMTELEEACDAAACECEKAENKAAALEEALDRLSCFSASIGLLNERKKRLASVKEQLSKYEAAAEKWPGLIRSCEQGKKLQKEQESRKMIDRFLRAEELHNELEQLEKRLSSFACPTESDISSVKRNSKKADLLKNKLCGMNAAAKITMLGDNTVRVTSVLTNEEVRSEDGTFNFSQAVRVTVPGVLEMLLSPQDADADSLRQQISLLEAEISEIFEKYSVKSLEELEEKARIFSQFRMKAESIKTKLNLLLDGVSYETLAQRAGTVGEARTAEEIKDSIFSLTGSADISRFVTACETTMKAFAEEYESPEKLSEKISVLTQEKEKINTALTLVGNIPDEYRKIPDIDAYLNEQKEKLKLLQLEKQEALKSKSALVSRLEAFHENYGDDIRVRLKNTESKLEEQKALLSDWKNILHVFYEQKNKLSQNPMENLGQRFSDYLSAVSLGNVTCEFPEKDKLDMNILSRDRFITYAQLSEGTKETVSLCFRLSVLDHLFPEGGGVIVFDDPFSDMDEERKKQACTLVKKCAERHQVIFLTCHDEYEELLNTKAISLK